jgi:PUA-domain protein
VSKRELKVTKRYKLSKKELKALRQEIAKNYPRFPLQTLEDVEYAKVGGMEFIIIGGIPAFFTLEKQLVPVLLFLLRRGYDWLPTAVVDRGASKALARGADLMVPGIRSVDEFDEGEIVAIIDEESRAPVAVGRALMSSREIEEKLSGERRGKAVKNLHYPGDQVWEAAKLLH